LGGIEATRLIRQFSPDLPIIALTAYVSIKNEQEALQSGCNEFLPKPLDNGILIQMINRLLG